MNQRTPSQRQLRVGGMLRRVLAEILGRSPVRDPDLENTPVTVTEIDVSADLRNATAYVVPLGGGDQEAVLAALTRHSKFLRGEVARNVHLKYIPELKFAIDDSFDASDRVSEILRSSEVARDLGSGGSGKER